MPLPITWVRLPALAQRFGKVPQKDAITIYGHDRRVQADAQLGGKMTAGNYVLKHLAIFGRVFWRLPLNQNARCQA